jgi:protein-tyrosine phosphatase
MPGVPLPTRILFVCMGNIIRSPLAENLFRHLANEAGLDGMYEADSAGTGGWHAGEEPDARMRRTARHHGLTYTGSARQVRLDDFDSFDLIIAMDAENRRDLAAMARTPARRRKIRMLLDYDPSAGPQASVPDPYYGGDADFEETYRVIESGVRGLLRKLESTGP